MTRSRLGDLIVMHGPYQVGALVPNWVMRFVESAELNALRDELIELRKVQTDHEDAAERALIDSDGFCNGLAHYHGCKHTALPADSPEADAARAELASRIDAPGWAGWSGREDAPSAAPSLPWTRERFEQDKARYQMELSAIVFRNRRSDGPRAAELCRRIETVDRILTDPAYGLTEEA